MHGSSASAGGWGQWALPWLLGISAMAFLGSFHSPEKEAGGQGAPGGTPTSLTKHVKELTSSVDTVAEGLAGLGRRVDGVATDLGRVREDVALTRQAVAALQAATQDILQRLPAPPPPPATAAGPRQPRAQW